MTIERDRAFRRAQAALNPRRPKVRLACLLKRPKKWKQQYRRRDKMLRAARIGLVWPHAAWREHLEEAECPQETT